MGGSPGAGSEHWQIVLIIVEQDGSLVLVAEPTRHAVPCRSVANSVNARTAVTFGARSTYPGVAIRCGCEFAADGGSAMCQIARVRSSPSVSMAYWRITPGARTRRPTC